MDEMIKPGDMIMPLKYPCFLDIYSPVNKKRYSLQWTYHEESSDFDDAILFVGEIEDDLNNSFRYAGYFEDVVHYYQVLKGEELYEFYLVDADINTLFRKLL